MRGFMHILEILFRRGSLKIVCNISKLKKKCVEASRRSVKM